MNQKMPPYIDRRYPPQVSIHEIKNAAHEVQKRRDARCWNEIEGKFHYRYVDIDKYETVERIECVARFVGNVPNGSGSIHNRYFPRGLDG